MIEGFRYMYLRDEREFPVALIAYIVDRNENLVTYGVATFNANEQIMKPIQIGNPKEGRMEQVLAPRKIKFDRKFLREIAVGRLCLTRNSIKLPMKEYNSLQRIHTILVTEVAKDSSLPRRTQKAVHSWLKNASQKQPVDIDHSDEPMIH